MQLTNLTWFQNIAQKIEGLENCQMFGKVGHVLRIKVKVLAF